MLAVDHLRYKEPMRAAHAPAVRIRPAVVSSPRPAPQRSFGGVGVDLYDGPTRRLVATSGSVDVIMPVVGSVRVVIAGEARRVDPGRALLLATREPADCSWAAGSVALVLQVTRAAVQAQHFAATGEPRRLGFGLVEFAYRGALTMNLAALRASDAAAGAAFVGVLATELAAHGAPALLFPVVGSVARALDRLREAPTETSAEALAGAAGVTSAVLRRNVRELTGQTLTSLLLDARLDWVHTRLKSHHEVRTIAALAAAAGRTSAAIFNRGYRRRFGETPTQTRARSFSGGRSVDIER